VTPTPAPRLIDETDLHRRSRWLAALAGTVWLAGCGGGSAGPACAGVAVVSGAVVVSGTATYDSVPANSSGVGLNYSATTQKPIRGAPVQLLSSSGTTVASTTTSELGAYSMSVSTAQTCMTVRVRAELKRSGGSGDRDFSVLDNTNGNALYVLDSASFTPTAAATTQNLRAASGWGGSGYTGARSAAPFAILDTIYAAQAKVATASPTVNLPVLQVFWSANNRPTSGNLAQGLIGTSFFTGSETSGRRLYILGAENTDTDEYDSPVVAHEFGHYLQSAVSRDDSVGGSHTGSDRLDMRVAFSEGWGNAWAGMALGSPIYTDSLNANQAGGFALNVGTAPTSNRGWYSEASAQYLLWTLHQDAAVGFTPIYNSLTSLAVAPSFSSLYSFAAALKVAVPAQASAITSLYGGQLIVAQDAFGTGETNSGSVTASLPVYKTHTAALGVAQNYCVNTEADAGNAGNKLGRHVFIRITASGARTLTATRNGGSFSGSSDPDLLLVKSDGSRVSAFVETTPVQALTTTLPSGSHVVALEDANLTPSANSCFDFRVD
jgi:hypothetical protein